MAPAPWRAPKRAPATAPFVSVSPPSVTTARSTVLEPSLLAHDLQSDPRREEREPHLRSVDGTFPTGVIHQVLELLGARTTFAR